MKNKIILLCVFVGIMFNAAKAQIVLDTVFPSLLTKTGQLIRLEKSGYKWLINDRDNYVLTFLNMDHSLYRQFNYPVDMGTSVFKMEYISEVLFDNDSTNIEYVENYNVSGHRYIKIFNEDGTLLFYRDNATIDYGSFTQGSENTLLMGITNTDAGAVMMLRIDSMQNPWVEVYKLPGYLQCSVCTDEHITNNLPVVLLNNFSVYKYQGDLNPYPNPSTGATTIEYSLPLKYPTGKMTITDMNGKIVLSYNIAQQSTNVIIEKGALSTGAYSCTIEAGGEVVSKKFIRIE